MKSKLFKGLRIIGYLIGFSVLLYPMISNYINVKNASQVIDDYDDKIAETDASQKEELLNLAIRYNELLIGNTSFSDPFGDEIKDDDLYEQILNVSDNGMMGYIRIPKIKVELPIYHGTSESVLQVGAGHLMNSSLPIGGINSHAVITGHRGLPSAKLFTDLDKLEIGDVFYLKVLGNSMAYEVDQIITVLPNELDALKVTAGQDYVSLVTCTPYAVNTHRLIVRGHRIDYQEAFKNVPDQKPKFDIPFELKILALGLVSLIVAVWIIKRYYRGRRV